MRLASWPCLPAQWVGQADRTASQRVFKLRPFTPNLRPTMLPARVVFSTIFRTVEHLAAGVTLDADQGSNGAPIHNRLPRRLICRPDGVVEITSSGYWKYSRGHMGSSQKRAIRNYRSRLGKRGLARFEVLGRDTDRDLIRSVARRLSEDTPEAPALRATISKSVAGEPPKPGGILAALRRSPLVGADLELSRPRDKGRKVDL
jgi:hypothetical protein